jgi:hypothetical protein
LWLRLSERFELDNVPETLFQWRMSPSGIYATRRAAQLQYGGIGLAFAEERRRYGSDSYAVLDEAGGDVEAFASRYRMQGRLHAIWGELLFRGLSDPAAARPHLMRALKQGALRPRTLGCIGLLLLGLRWPGRPAEVPPAAPPADAHAHAVP